MALRGYCSENDVETYLPDNVQVSGTNPSPNWAAPNQDLVTTSDLDFFITAACDRIDAAIGTIYDVPAKMVAYDGIVDFPRPLRQINAILATQMLYEQKLQGGDHQKSESQKEREKWALEELAAIQNGERILQGLRATRGSRFVNSNLYNAPRNPAQGGRSKGNNG